MTSTLQGLSQLQLPPLQEDRRLPSSFPSLHYPHASFGTDRTNYSFHTEHKHREEWKQGRLYYYRSLVLSDPDDKLHLCPNWTSMMYCSWIVFTNHYLHKHKAGPVYIHAIREMESWWITGEWNEVMLNHYRIIINSIKRVLSMKFRNSEYSCKIFIDQFSLFFVWLYCRQPAIMLCNVTHNVTHNSKNYIRFIADTLRVIRLFRGTFVTNSHYIAMC